MILSTVRMVISPKKRGEALRILKMTAEYCRVRPGCLSYNIYEDVYESNILMFMELWRSKEELEEHLRSEEYRNVLLVIEMAAEKPDIRFDVISGSTGIETVEKVRQYNR